MKFGKVLTYKDIDEAKKLVGKKVVASDFYASICDDDTACDCAYDTLKAVHADKVCPFECNTFYDGAQFIREILPDKPEYEPYDLSDKKVRDSLRGRWYKAEDLAVIEKAYRENPDDMKARVAYLEAGIREVRARLKRMYEESQYHFGYWNGVKAGVGFAVRLLDEILPESDEESGLPILTRDKEVEE